MQYSKILVDRIARRIERQISKSNNQAPAFDSGTLQYRALWRFAAIAALDEYSKWRSPRARIMTWMLNAFEREAEAQRAVRDVTLARSRPNHPVSLASADEWSRSPMSDAIQNYLKLRKD